MGRLVEVSDTGVGIVPELLTRIFNPFEQGESDPVRQFGGLGLGLPFQRPPWTLTTAGLIAQATARIKAQLLPLNLIQCAHR